MKANRFTTLLLILFLCLAGLRVNAQAPSWNWVTPSDPERRYEATIVTDQHGFIYAGGNVDRVGFILTKYKPNGVKIWSKIDSSTMVQQLSIDTTGNLYIAAETGSWFLFYIHTAKLDSAGNRLWTKGIYVPRGPNDVPTGALLTGAADAAGNTYMSGIFKSLSNLTHFDTIPLSNLAAENYFLAKYNNSGQIQWLRFYNDPVVAIAAGSQNSYYIGTGPDFKHFTANHSLIWQQNVSGTFGNSSSPWSSVKKFKPDAQGNLYVQSNKLAKYTSNGTLAWAKTTNYVSTDFSLTSAGNILVTGFFRGTATFGNSVPDFTSATTDEALFVARFSGVDGSASWAKQISSSGFTTGEAILSLPNGNFLVAGNFDGGATFDQLSLTGTSFFLANLSENILGMAEAKTTVDFKLYPNPATSKVTISNPEFRNAGVEIFNVAGQRILEVNYPAEGNLKIATEDWPAGLYIVKITAKGKVYNQKLMVSH